MPRNTAKNNETKRLKLLARREQWFSGKSCAYCKSTKRLELDHIDPNTKLRRNDHQCWGWATQRREAELAKCQALCRSCHEKKTGRENRAWKLGQPGVNHKLSCEEVKQIRNLLYLAFTQDEIAKRFGVIQAQISNIKNGVHWGHCK